MLASALAGLIRRKFQQACQQLDARIVSDEERRATLKPFGEYFTATDVLITTKMEKPCHAGDRVVLTVPNCRDREGEPINIPATAFTSARAGDDADTILDHGESARAWNALQGLTSSL